MGEYAESLRAIFRCWEYGEKLNYQGKHYKFSLMTPEFSPPKQNLPLPPIAMAAVGPLMLKTAARVSDSVRLHSFATREYLEKVVVPMLDAELAANGKSLENFEITGGGFIATGPNEAAVKEAAAEGTAASPARRRRSLQDATSLIEAEARQAFEDLGRIPVAQAADEV